MIDVVCALIINGDKVFAAQRSEKMSLPLKWEFPGGKVEAEETEEECLIRELKEELNIDVEIIERINSNVHHYEHISIQLIPFIVKSNTTEVKLSEHITSGWFNKEELIKLDWAPADIPILQEFTNIHISK